MRVDLKFSIEVPDGTDPQQVLGQAQESIDSEVDHGGLCRWGDWSVGNVELLGVDAG